MSVHFWLVSIILTSAMNCAYSKTTTGCFNIDNKNVSLEFFCEDQSTPKKNCHSDIIDKSYYLPNPTRAKIKAIKFSSDCYDRWGHSTIAPTSHWMQIFPNLRSMEVSYTHSSILKQIPFNLDELFLGHNQISRISEDTFLHTTHLTDLDLSFNRISTIERKSFNSLTELKTLNLSNNSIGTIDNELFKYNRKLEVLQLQNNPIVRGHFLSALINLKRLNISGCHIQNTTQMIELLPSSLELLDASSNFIGKLDSSIFNRLKHLKYLNLSNTSLSNLQFDSFYFENTLKVLDLSYNQLKTINFTMISLPSRLKTLNLEGNEFQNIDIIDQHHFHKVILLDISKNRLTCEYIASYLDTKWSNWNSYQDGMNTYVKHDCPHIIKMEKGMNRSYILSCIQAIDSDSELFAQLYMEHMKTKRKKNGGCDENLFCLI